MSGKPVIAVTALGHYIYFDQFEGLRAELEGKAADFLRRLADFDCSIYYTGYADTPEGVADMAREVFIAGAVGFNIEDSDGIPGAWQNAPGSSSIGSWLARQSATICRPSGV